MSEAAKLHKSNENLCNGNPKITGKHERALQWLFKNIGETQIRAKTTPQHEAACWMFRDDQGWSVQRFAMATIYYATKGAGWDMNTDWVTQKHECSWYGVGKSVSWGFYEFLHVFFSFVLTSSCLLSIPATPLQ